MVRVVLSKQNNIRDQIEIEFDVYDTVTASKWINLLKQTLKSGTPLKKHVSHHGWIMDQSRTLKHIVDDLHMRVDTINKFNFAKQAWHLKNNKIKINIIKVLNQVYLIKEALLVQERDHHLLI